MIVNINNTNPSEHTTNPGIDQDRAQAHIYKEAFASALAAAEALNTHVQTFDATSAEQIVEARKESDDV